MPALIFDNPFITADQEYMESLLNLPVSVNGIR